MATPEASGSGGSGEGRDPSVTYYRLEEVAKRNSAEETWMVIHGRVYNITRFLSEVRVYLGGGRFPRACRGEGGGGGHAQPSGARKGPRPSGDSVRFLVQGALAAWSQERHQPVFRKEKLRLAEA